MTVDSLRRDAVDLTADSHTPAIRRLAREGIRATDAVAGGNWTPFSFPSILGGRPVFFDAPDIGVGTRPTLAETLADADVTTAGFNAANGFLAEYWGYDRGFDRFESFVPDPNGPVSRWLTAHPTVKAWLRFAGHPFRDVRRRLGGGDPPDPENLSRLRDVETRARSFLADVEPPFFLWIHLMDTHTPYVPARRYVRAVSGGTLGSAGMIRAHLKAGLGRAVDDGTLDVLWTLYLAAARQVDRAVGRLLDALVRQGLRERTCVVLAGDHGEEFQEHGHLAHYPKLYRELVEVPLIVSRPGGDAARIDPPVGLDAVPATVCDALGLPVPDHFTGRPIQREADASRPDPVTSVAVRGESVTAQPIPRTPAEGEVLVSARLPDWTYIRHAGGGREELYDRRVDPAEHDDRLDADAPLAPGTDVPLDRLRGAADRRLARVERDSAAPREIPGEMTDQLAALGYR